MMVHDCHYNSLPVRTGDLLCMTDGDHADIGGQFWRVLGTFLHGPIDHIVVYLGPGGRCVESGPHGVATFEMPGPLWDASLLAAQRGRLRDRIHGVAYPLQGREFSADEEAEIRKQVAAYCLAHVGKPYNLNFLDRESEEAFYCSQLAYKAYQSAGIHLETEHYMPNHLHSHRIVFPKGLWDHLPRQQVPAEPM